MKRRIQITDDTMAQEPMLPLINIVFLLLIFFMIAGSLQKLGPFDVNPPASVDASEKDDETVVLWVDKTGKLGVDDKSGPLANITGLLPANFQDHPIEIRADRETDGQMVVALLKRLQELGVDKVQLMTASQAQD
ncbi:ExbD/TolR family protein [Thalassospira mesophila]|uniref:ExbD/TolR family protein n=1 Tax=Thalassospira mesophila TaxID=1293891 RepID=UPI000A1FC9C4|nr:biopolymer transporter ExbD [Thalassospira mesophila]